MGGSPQSLDHLVSEYIGGRRARKEVTDLTARNMRSALGGLADTFGCRPVDRLGRSDIERWLASSSHLAPATRRSRLSYVRGFCAWLVERGCLRANPCSGVRAPRQPRSVPRALPGRAVTAILAACPDARARLIVTLMVQQGLRCCEVAGLDLGDIEGGPDDAVMRVVGKGGHTRVLPVVAATRRAIEDWCSERGWWAGPLVISYRTSCRMTPDAISRLVRGWMVEAGVKQRRGDGRTAHALRHTAATDVLRAGATLRDVQTMLGHASLATTQVYLPAVVEPLAQAMEGRDYRRLAVVRETRRAA